MSRILAIDYGSKRCGIAVTDEFRIIASGLTAVPPDELISFLENFLKTEQVEIIVVGKPKRLHNVESEIETEIGVMISKIISKFPEIKIVRLDERFTSKIAQKTLINSGLKKKKRQQKELIDEISATILLQDYLKING